VRRLTLGLLLLRATGILALLLLLWNPVTSRAVPGGDRPLVLLDASLSMTGRGAVWRAALDTARALARGGLIWRFGDRVAAFDSTLPADGASRLAPALEAAAARGGPLVIVSDGEIVDRAALPADLLRRARVVVLPRPGFFDAFVAGVEGSRRVDRHDPTQGELRNCGETGSGKRETWDAGGERRRAKACVEGRCSAGQRHCLHRSHVSRFPFPVSRVERPRRASRRRARFRAA